VVLLRLIEALLGRSDRSALLRRERAVRTMLRRLPARRRRELEAHAGELARVRAEIGALTREPGCCERCVATSLRAVGGPRAGEPAGGLCCGGSTDEVFSPVDLAVLELVGRRASAPARRTARHGCLFRAASGCLLAAGDRPSGCVRHMCRELAAVIHRRGDMPRVLALDAELEAGAREIARALGLP
jgi:hypothetical protein